MAVNFRSLQDQLRERLLAHIAAGELTGLRLARDTGFQQAHISNFLKRKRGLSLEAMDLILKATRISLAELWPSPKDQHVRRRQASGDSTGFLTIPILENENCVATQVPKQDPRDSLKLASRMATRLRPAMQTPREHWER